MRNRETGSDRNPTRARETRGAEHPPSPIASKLSAEDLQTVAAGGQLKQMGLACHNYRDLL